ncbi:MAG: PIN domain-containing protein [Gemmatimonadetes bacterium]|nr:PIN domain-containing protein [Gemmatimonadota bacterium]
MVERIVLDTSVFVAALKRAGGPARAVLRLGLTRCCQPIVGDKLFMELEDVMSRTELFADSPLTGQERDDLLDAWLNVCEWVPVFFLWRPNLPDEGDNHLIELAVAGMAGTIVTENVRDLRGGELRFPGLAAETPAAFMARWRRTHGHDDDSTA